MFLCKLKVAGAVLVAVALAGTGAAFSHRAAAGGAAAVAGEDAPRPAGPATADPVEPPAKEKPAKGKGGKEEPAVTATSPDGKVQAVAEGKTITLLDVATGKILARILGHADRVTALAFSPDGKVLASGSLDRSVRLWDLPTGREIRKMVCKGGITSLAYSGDGRTLTAREGARGKRVWDVATGKEVP